MIFEKTFLIALGVIFAFGCGNDEVDERLWGDCGCDGQITFTFEDKEAIVLMNYMGENNWDFIDVKTERSDANPDRRTLFTPCNLTVAQKDAFFSKDSLRLLVSGKAFKLCEYKFPAQSMYLDEITLID